MAHLIKSSLALARSVINCLLLNLQWIPLTTRKAEAANLQNLHCNNKNKKSNTIARKRNTDIKTERRVVQKKGTSTKANTNRRNTQENRKRNQDIKCTRESEDMLKYCNAQVEEWNSSATFFFYR